MKDHQRDQPPAAGSHTSQELVCHRDDWAVLQARYQPDDAVRVGAGLAAAGVHADLIPEHMDAGTAVLMLNCITRHGPDQYRKLCQAGCSHPAILRMDPDVVAPLADIADAWQVDLTAARAIVAARTADSAVLAN